MEPILEVSKLHKSYKLDMNTSQTILNDINFKIFRGEFVSLMGPSGSGKSTLLYTVSGMDKVTSGEVIFNKQKLTALSENGLSKLRLYKMGFIFQQIHLLKNLSIFDNIILPGYLANKSERKQINHLANHLMKEMNIETLAHHNITQVSGGQLQRAAICRSIINNPDILFGDEPTGALNSKFAADIMNILKKINEAGTTILLATHDIKVAAKTNRVIYLKDGKILSELSFDKNNTHSNDETRREAILVEWLTSNGF